MFKVYLKCGILVNHFFKESQAAIHLPDWVSGLLDCTGQFQVKKNRMPIDILFQNTKRT